MSDLQPHSCLARVQVWWELPPATVGAWATTLQQTCKQTIKHGLHVCLSAVCLYPCPPSRLSTATALAELLQPPPISPSSGPDSF